MENYSCLFFSTQPVPIAAFLKDDEKRDWLVEPHCFTFGLTFMIAPMRNAALVSVGGTSLLGAGLGGLFLAHRALAPARLAWANQQRFITDASHELRTPLTLLRADAEVLLRSREGMAAEDAPLLEDIVAEANHMAGLTNNLLTLARLDSRSSHHEHEVVRVASLADAVAEAVLRHG